MEESAVNYAEYRREARRLWKSFGLTRPSTVVSSEQFIEGMVRDWTLFGRAYIWLFRGSGGKLEQVILLPFEDTYFNLLKDGDAYYVVHLPDRVVRLRDDEVLRLDRPSSLGKSSLVKLRRHIDEMESLDRVRHSSNPACTLNFDRIDGLRPLSESEIEVVRAAFEGEPLVFPEPDYVVNG